MNIDWSRVMEPQEDGYDIEAVRELASRPSVYWPDTYRKADEFKLEPLPEDMRNTEYYDHIDLDAPEVAEMLAVLHLWPLGARSAKAAVDVYYPMLNPGPWGGGTGCTCGHNRPTASVPKMAIYSTINCSMGGAEGFVHEAGHCRLWLCGMAVEDHDGTLILNGDSSSDELYDSPIRRDIQRPMCAVIQAQYSYIWCSALDRVCFDAAETDEEARRAVAYLNANVPRIAPAQDLIRKHAKPNGEDGQKFLDSLLDWGDRVIDAGQRIMDAAA